MCFAADICVAANNSDVFRNGDYPKPWHLQQRQQFLWFCLRAGEAVDDSELPEDLRRQREQMRRRKTAAAAAAAKRKEAEVVELEWRRRK